MSTLERDLYRSLRDLVLKEEIRQQRNDEIRGASSIPRPECYCGSMSSGPGCPPCLIKRARKVMAEYEAANAPGPRCADCGQPAGENSAMRFEDDTTELVCGRCFAIAQALAVLDEVGA